MARTKQTARKSTEWQGPPQAARHQGGSQIRPHHRRRERSPTATGPAVALREIRCVRLISRCFPGPRPNRAPPRLARARPDIRKCASRCRACGCLRHTRDGDVSFEGVVVVPDAFSGSSPSSFPSFFRLFYSSRFVENGLVLGFVSRARSSVFPSLTPSPRDPFNATGSAEVHRAADPQAPLPAPRPRDRSGLQGGPSAKKLATPFASGFRVVCSASRASALTFADQPNPYAQSRVPQTDRFQSHAVLALKLPGVPRRASSRTPTSASSNARDHHAQGHPARPPHPWRARLNGSVHSSVDETNVVHEWTRAK